MASESVEREVSAGSRVLPLLGAACAVGVGSIYYNQPLLMVMGKSFGQNAREMGFVAVATQVGYAAGILLFVPMGDITERRSLMMKLYGGVSVALVLAALAQGLPSMMVASVLIGLMAAVTHVVLPIAPDLVSPEKRGHAVGTVMTGLLLGVLLARTFAGWVARSAGWRTVFALAAAMNLLFVPVLAKVMPKLEPKQRMKYVAAMRSLWTLFRSEPLLRESCGLGALVFASFSCFWTTLAFLLYAHYGMGPGVAGTFGLVGAAGALVAPFAGRLSDKRGTRYVVSGAGALMTAAYVWMWMEERARVPVTVHMVALVVGVLVLDVGMQMMQVGNQTRIFGLQEGARSRINTVYMVSYFGGGALGSALSALAWARWGWDGVSGLAIGLILAAGAWHAVGHSRGLGVLRGPAGAVAGH